MHLLAGWHHDLPVALGLVGVVLGIVWGLDGHLVIKMKIIQQALPNFST